MSKSNRLVVGLTGGIGSGKTTAAKLFQTLGAGVIDTDEISHQLTQAGQPALLHIRKRFGADYFTAEGALDRARMRELAFQDPQARRDLEAMLHPLIRAEAGRQARASRAPYALLVVPLLVETEAYSDLISRVLVVDCEEQLQIERTMPRSGLSAPQVREIMAVQAPRDVRLAAADDVIDNNRGLLELGEQVRDLHARYLALARAK